MLNQNDAQTEDGHAMMELDAFQSLRNLSHVDASVTSVKEMSEVDTWRLQHCGHRGANKDGHSLQLLKPGFIQAHVYTSPKTDRKVVDEHRSSGQPTL